MRISAGILELKREVVRGGGGCNALASRNQTDVNDKKVKKKKNHLYHHRQRFWQQGPVFPARPHRYK